MDTLLQLINKMKLDEITRKKRPKWEKGIKEEVWAP